MWIRSWVETIQICGWGHERECYIYYVDEREWYKYVDEAMRGNIQICYDKEFTNMMRISIIMWIRLCYGVILIYADEIIIMNNTNMFMVLW